MAQTKKPSGRTPGRRRRRRFRRLRKEARRQKAQSPVGLDVSLTPKNEPAPSPFSAEYLRGLKNHDPEIESHFYDYFKSRLLTKLSGHRLQESDKHDVIQETFARVMKAVQQDEIRIPEAFGGYVNGVCRNVLSEYWRPPDDNVDDIDPPDPAIDGETLVLYKERQELVETILKHLRVKDRNLLRAKIFDNLSAEEMMVKFGASSPGHLRLLLHRARKKFEKACKKRGVEFFLG